MWKDFVDIIVATLLYLSNHCGNLAFMVEVTFKAKQPLPLYKTFVDKKNGFVFCVVVMWKKKKC